MEKVSVELVFIGPQCGDYLDLYMYLVYIFHKLLKAKHITNNFVTIFKEDLGESDWR